MTSFYPVDSLKPILIDLAMAVIKRDDAPCSAETHLDRAITDLSAMVDVGDLDLDVREVIDGAKERMAMLGYPS